MMPKQFYDWQTAGGTVESHPHLWDLLDPELKEIIQKPSAGEKKNG
jgi:hypothetical protein